MHAVSTPVLIVAAAITLLACGKTEDLPAPEVQPPAAEIVQAEPVPAAPLTEPPETTTAIPLAPPVVATPPAATQAAPTRPVDAVPAPTPADTGVPGTPAPDLALGQATYRKACAFCHDKGIAGAPKTGDHNAWRPRLAQGMDALYTAALRGKGTMPAKGGNPVLTENDVHAAVDYLVAQSR